VNRVGFKRIEIEGSLEKFGFFDEYTQESLDFDTDEELLMHITEESVKAANEITEDQLQIDLLNAAGVVRYAGNATSTATLGGGTAASNAEDVVVYDDLVKLSIELDQNRTPKTTKLITGSRMIDTKVINAARYAYIGSELQPAFMRMTDYHGEKAFIPVAQYGEAGTVARGEFGAVDCFRLIVVPEMMHWDAAGATVGSTADEVAMWSTDAAGVAKVNVYPILVIGDGSFTTIGFQTDGKTVKFKITHKPPGKETADRNDPYGETGFYSIKWYYGFMTLRSERIALIKTVATL
jgi:N4-gp56 family major capsid protein